MSLGREGGGTQQGHQGPKSANFSAKNRRFAKILVQKFRPGGVRSSQKIYFVQQNCITSSKNFHGRAKILSSSLKNPGGGKGRSLPHPPQHFPPDLARIAFG